MEAMEIDSLIKQLSTGFEVLQDEYSKLFTRHQALERKLVTAREQYNEIAQVYGIEKTWTPPLSLSSAPAPHKEKDADAVGAADILDGRTDIESRDVANKVRAAITAANALRVHMCATPEDLADITDTCAWASAEKRAGTVRLMSSISESPLERDFTVQGRPSKLGCPFSSMEQKNISIHAAGVLGKYNQDNKVNSHGSAEGASVPASSASCIHGRDSFSRRRGRRASFIDPIKAEICGISDHESPRSDVPVAERNAIPVKSRTENAGITEPGACPIRFLGQHSPEEVATYFEKHKHELPRSHEICVMRYQSNKEQIKQLDAKYGNLISMITGLGEKHKNMLPSDPDEAADEKVVEVLSNAKVHKWASTVSAQDPELDMENDTQERQPHFERPLREVRVGESPNRPWGIPIPAKYLEQFEGETSNNPGDVRATHPATPAINQTETKQEMKSHGKCPFGHSAAKVETVPEPAILHPDVEISRDLPTGAPKINARTNAKLTSNGNTHDRTPHMVFTGPVLIGYSPEDAARILTGLKMNE